MKKIDRKGVEHIVMKVYGSFFIIFSLVSIWYLIFYGRRHYSAVPIIDLLWDLSKYEEL